MSRPAWRQGSRRLLNFLFLGGGDPPCDGGTAAGLNPGAMALLDSNGDGQVDISDPVYVLQFLFLGGGPPALGTDCVTIRGCPDTCQ